jgi:hypothetical protein
MSVNFETNCGAPVEEMAADGAGASLAVASRVIVVPVTRPVFAEGEKLSTSFFNC